MLWSENDSEKPQHFPPWRVGVCLNCQHCYDYVGLERCPLCGSKRVASIETIVENWHLFPKGTSAA